MRRLFAVVLMISLALVIGCDESSTTSSPSSSSSSSTAQADITGTWSFAVGDVLDSQGGASTGNIGNMYYFANGKVTRAFRGSGTYTTSAATAAGTPVKFSVTLPDFPGFLIEFDGTMSGPNMTGTVTVTWPQPAPAKLVAEYTGYKLSSANTLP